MHTLLKILFRLLSTLKLLLPALIPSWNFFDIIAPSPRIQFTLLNKKDDSSNEWHEFRPRPVYISFIQMLKRMFWNTKWNELLYMYSCAERIIENYTVHSENEILQRIIKDLNNTDVNNLLLGTAYLQFRLLVVERKGEQLSEEVIFLSRLAPL